MKVKVNKKLCAGCGLCVDICPEVYETNGSTTVVKADAPLGDAKVMEQAKMAAEMCPSQAIEITE